MGLPASAGLRMPSRHCFSIIPTASTTRLAKALTSVSPGAFCLPRLCSPFLSAPELSAVRLRCKDRAGKGVWGADVQKSQEALGLLQFSHLDCPHSTSHNTGAQAKGFKARISLGVIVAGLDSSDLGTGSCVCQRRHQI